MHLEHIIHQILNLLRLTVIMTNLFPIQLSLSRGDA